MEDYMYAEDGRLHTRYSELVKCTEGQIERVVTDRLYGIKHDNEFTSFGTERHKKFEEYLKENKCLPKSFEVNLEVDIERVEKSYELEVFENVVIHFTPDLHNHHWVADFKTTARGSKAYKTNKQLLFYAWLLGLYHGKPITKIYYLCELWDKERTEIQGYEVLEQEITPEDIVKVKEWAKERVNTLYNQLMKVEV